MKIKYKKMGNKMQQENKTIKKDEMKMEKQKR